jgi:Ankyrin repeats (3 copies)
VFVGHAWRALNKKRQRNFMPLKLLDFPPKIRKSLEEMYSDSEQLNKVEECVRKVRHGLVLENCLADDNFLMICLLSFHLNKTTEEEVATVLIRWAAYQSYGKTTSARTKNYSLANEHGWEKLKAFLLITSNPNESVSLSTDKVEEFYLKMREMPDSEQGYQIITIPYASDVFANDEVMEALTERVRSRLFAPIIEEDKIMLLVPSFSMMQQITSVLSSGKMSLKPSLGVIDDDDFHELHYKNQHPLGLSLPGHIPTSADRNKCTAFSFLLHDFYHMTVQSLLAELKPFVNEIHKFLMTHHWDESLRNTIFFEPFIFLFSDLDVSSIAFLKDKTEDIAPFHMTSLIERDPSIIFSMLMYYLFCLTPPFFPQNLNETEISEVFQEIPKSKTMRYSIFNELMTEFMNNDRWQQYFNLDPLKLLHHMLQYEDWFEKILGVTVDSIYDIQKGVNDLLLYWSSNENRLNSTGRKKLNEFLELEQDLERAIKEDNIIKVKECIAKRGAVNCYYSLASMRIEIPLQLAIENNARKTIAFLLEQEPHLLTNPKLPDDETNLIPLAATWRSKQVFKYIAQQGISITDGYNELSSVIALLMERGYVECLHFLLNSYVLTPSLVDKMREQENPHPDCEKLLHEFLEYSEAYHRYIDNEDINGFRQLFQDGLSFSKNLNLRIMDGFIDYLASRYVVSVWTFPEKLWRLQIEYGAFSQAQKIEFLQDCMSEALSAESGEKQLRLVRWILDQGYTFSHHSFFSSKEACEAYLEGNVEVLKLLFSGFQKSGASKQRIFRSWESSKSLLLEAVRANPKPELILWFLNNGLNLNEVVQYTCTQNTLSPEFLQQLYSAGVTPNQIVNKGQSLLITAIVNDFTEFALKMISDGAHPNHIDSQGNTPLHHSVMKGNTAIIKALLEKGAVLDRVNLEGKTPCMLAWEQKFPPIGPQKTQRWYSFFVSKGRQERSLLGTVVDSVVEITDSLYNA